MSAAEKLRAMQPVVSVYGDVRHLVLNKAQADALIALCEALQYDGDMGVESDNAYAAFVASLETP